MNILFVLKSYEMGGVEVVTSILANKFVKEGHNVSIFAFASATKGSIEDRFDQRIHIYTLKRLKYCSENVYAMRAVMVKEQIQIIINQWGLPFYPLKTIKHASKGLNVKIISVYHNTPDMNGRLQTVDNQIISASIVRKIILTLKRRLFKEITAYSMRWNYRNSDLYMVLSPSFIKIFQDFTGMKNTPKLIVQTNPVTIATPINTIDLSLKKKEIIFVGRLDCNQKRVDRIIMIWSSLEKSHLDWNLTIIGDGPDKTKLEELANSLSLKRISFEGFKNPIEYYKRAAILLLTSDFEGFGLVIVEGMSWGVVPVVYNSYAAAKDIINDGRNGLLIQPQNKHFNQEPFVSMLDILMHDDSVRNQMANHAIDKSKDYAINKIYHQWLEVFKQFVDS